MYITELSIKRPTVSWVMSLILIIFGLFVFWKLPVRELPDGIQPPVVQIQVDYKSAASDIVDQEVTQVIEDVIGVKDFIKLSEFNKNIGIGLLPGTSNSELDEYLEYAHSVLLLGVNPGFSNQSQAIDLPRKVNDFNTSFPNYSGEVIVDGGVKNEDLEVFEKIGVDVVVQGGAIFG